MENNESKSEIKKMVLTLIKPVLMKVPWAAGFFAAVSFFITASIIQIIIGAIFYPAKPITFVILLAGFGISVIIAILGGFLVKIKAERKIIKKIEKAGIKINPEDKIKFSDFLKEK